MFLPSKTGMLWGLSFSFPHPEIQNSRNESRRVPPFDTKSHANFFPDPPARPGRSTKTCVGFTGIHSLGILAHRTSDDEQGVYNHFRNARYLGSMKPFSEGEPGSLGNQAKLEGFGFLLGGAGGARKLVNLTFGPFSIAILDYRRVMRLCNSDGNTQPQEFVGTVELSKLQRKLAKFVLLGWKTTSPSRIP